MRSLYTEADANRAIEYVDAYVRYSSHMQDDGNSIEYQMEEIEMYCQRHGMAIRKWYIDKAKSAKQAAGRDGFYELVNDIKSGVSAPNLLVWKTNRAFRNSYESHKYRKFLREHHVKLLSVTQTIDEDSSSGRLTTNILSDIDQYKSEEIAEHVSAALKSMARKGYWTGQTVPLGYKIVPVMDGDKPRKAYAINEETAPIVRQIFQDFVNGYTPAFILDWMRQEGLKTSKGNTYDYNALYRILKNDFYIGTRTYGTKTKDTQKYPNTVPAIIDKATFDQVQNIFISRRHTEPVKGRKSNRNKFYYLTGKMFCEKCGSPYIGRSCGGQAYYVCQARHRRKECDGKGIQKERVESAIFRAIRENIFSESAVDEIIKVVLDELEKSPIKETKSKGELTKRKNILIHEIAELTQMKLSKEITQEVFVYMKKPKDEELAEIELSLLALEHQQRNTVDEDFIRDFINDLFEKSESGKDELLKYVIDTVIEKVVVGDSEVNIYLAITFNQNVHKKASGFPDWSLCTYLTRKDVMKYK